MNQILTVISRNLEKELSLLCLLLILIVLSLFSPSKTKSEVLNHMKLYLPLVVLFYSYNQTEKIKKKKNEIRLVNTSIRLRM